MRLLLSGWVAPFAFALGLACYLNCTPCAFVFDDPLAIVNNRDVQHGAELGPVWVNDFWGKSLKKHDSHKSYRPLTILSFRFHTWWRQGPPRPEDFHFTNAVLHAAVCAAVAELAARAWNGERRGGLRVALLTSLLFAAHPVHVEAVTGTVGRAELLCALACMAGCASHSVAASMAPGDGWRGAGWTATRVAGAAGVLVSVAVAVLTKETGISLIGMLGAQEILVLLPARGWAGAPGVALRLLMLLLCGVAYMLMRLLLMTPDGEPLSLKAASLAESQLIRRAENPLTFVTAPLPRALSIAQVQVVYASMLLAPRDFCVEYSFDCIPMVESLSDPRNLASLLLLLALLSFAAHLLRRARTSDARATMGASAWLLLPWLPVSHVLLRLGTLVAERTMYMPSIGATLLVVHLLRPPPTRTRAPRTPRTPRTPRAERLHALRRLWWRRRGALPVGVAVGYLAARTLRRTLDWRTDETAFVSAIEVCPRSAKLQNQMCTLRSNQGRLDEAMAHCSASLRIDADFCDVHSNFAMIHLARDDLGAAVHHLNLSLPCVFTNVKSYKTLLAIYDLHLRRDPQNATTFGELASSHAVIGNRREAVLFYREAAALHLRSRDATTALAALAHAEELQRGSGPIVPASLPLGETEPDESQPVPRDCTLGYWRGRALLALERSDEALAAFAEVEGCDGLGAAAIRSAAAAEHAQLKRHLSRPAAAAANAAAAEAAAADAAAADAAAKAPTTAGSPAEPAPRVLALSFHDGVTASIRWAAARHGWQLEAPRVEDVMGGCDETGPPPRQAGGGGFLQVHRRYVFSRERSECLWRNSSLRAYLDRFDLVIVADTTAIARPMLQAGWPGRGSSARLLLWVCNRFDYGVVADAEYYALFRALPERVSVVAYTPFELEYARALRGVDLDAAATIRPIGLFAPPATATAPAASIEGAAGGPPAAAERARTFFLVPKVNEARLGLKEALQQLGVLAWTPGTWPHTAGRWAGEACDASCASRVVGSFRATIHVPYAPSTFALFEQAQAGKLTFVPSVGLMLKWYASDDLFFQATPNDFVATGMDSRPLSAQMLEMTEYYDPANAALFVYFDSLKDLRRQVAETDYAERERGVREWAARHTNTTARRWQAIDAYLARSPA